jgi:hypothetical protein
MKKIGLVTVSLLVFATACQSDKGNHVMEEGGNATEELVYDSAYDRFLDSVLIKKKSPDSITYEYKDVRVDELAPMASRYCRENGNRTAILREILLYKNFSRWATFDCLTLQ